MRNFSALAGLFGLLALLAPLPCRAATVEGFATDRLVTSAAGAGYVVMDALNMRGGLAGTAALSTRYAQGVLRVGGPDAANRLTVVDQQGSAQLSLAASYARWRLLCDFTLPLWSRGRSGTRAAGDFVAPTVDPGSHPDNLSDTRLGLDVRLAGRPRGPLRLGAAAHVYFPSGSPAVYDGDGTYRAMLRALLAGELRHFCYAGHLGIHWRPRHDDGALGEAPLGSEWLAGAAVAGRIRLPGSKGYRLVVGPEIFAALPIAAGPARRIASLEALLSLRLQAPSSPAGQLCLKLAGGAGLLRNLGTPQWRLLAAVELSGRAAGP